MKQRTTQPLDALPLEVVGRCGYAGLYERDRPAPPAGSLGAGDGGVSARDSIGLSFDGEGKVTDVDSRDDRR